MVTMDIQTFTEISYARAAGFFDGEGSVMIAHKGKSYYLRLSISQVTEHEDALRDFQVLFGGSVGNKGIPLKERHRRRPMSVWTLEGERAKQALICMYPYLRVKKSVAFLGIFFQKWKVEKRASRIGKDLTPEEIEVGNAMKSFISRLNRGNCPQGVAPYAMEALAEA